MLSFIGKEMIGIIGAMNREVKTLCEKMQNVEKTEINSLVFYKGTLNGKDAVVVKSGVGKVNAALCAQLLSLVFKADKIINTGIAGALAEGLNIFDFVVSTGAVYHDADITVFGYKPGELSGLPVEFSADIGMIAAAEKAFSKTKFSDEHKLIKGRIASGDQFISSSEKKNFIKKEFNPACVEMEGTAVAHACYLNKVPFIVVRCMSDMADDSGDSTYTFNEDTAAELSAEFTLNLVAEL